MAIKDKDDRPVIDQAQAGDSVKRGVSEQRRKIVKASAAAVPAIMTLRSGAAAAMTSINQCIADDAQRGSLLPESAKVWGDDPGEGALDEWARVKGKCVTKNNNKTYYCVQNMSGAWECYDADGMPPQGNSLQDSEIEAGDDCYLLAYVDSASGGYTWYPQRVMVVQDQAASPITGSCLTSMNPDVNIV